MEKSVSRVKKFLKIGFKLDFQSEKYYIKRNVSESIYI